MAKFTLVEKLDAQHPGLADQVGKWFNQGVTSCQVVELLRQRYQVAIGKSSVANFRQFRWVPERRSIQEKKIEMQAAQEAAQEQESRASIAALLFGDAK